MNFFRQNKTKQETQTHSVDVPKKMQCKIYSVSETGPVREANEDSIYFSYPENNFQNAFAMVADGMGGHNAGEVASKMACEMFMRLLRDKTITNAKVFLKDAIEEANKFIKNASEKNAEYKDMGTTVVTLLIQNGNATFAHVGDSRLYLYRDGVLKQLTTDNTLVNQMLKDGEITEEQARVHNMRNVITQALGTTKEIMHSISSIAVEKGDRFLLCSDGVHDVVSNEELEALLHITYPQLALETITALCMQRKASDNFSVIIVTIEEMDAAPIAITKEQNVML